MKVVSNTLSAKDDGAKIRQLAVDRIIEAIMEDLRNLIILDQST